MSIGMFLEGINIWMSGLVKQMVHPIVDEPHPIRRGPDYYEKAQEEWIYSLLS